MLDLSSDPHVAERQMAALIFLLTTFGHIDGDFDGAEREVVKRTIRRLVTERVSDALRNSDAATRERLVDGYARHFEEVFAVVDRQVAELFDESVSVEDGQAAFVHAMLEQRCYEALRSFDAKGQEALLSTVDELLMADGVAHPAELRFRSQLAAILEEDLGLVVVDEPARPIQRVIRKIQAPPHGGRTHPLLDEAEEHYSSDPIAIFNQMERDRELTRRFMAEQVRQRGAGKGRLRGQQRFSDLPAGSRFLDGHVHVLMPEPGRVLEILVLGDLHGCYSCLKAALMQSRFLEKVEAFRADPANNREPLLVLLGDYIDRGIFSYNGVLRAVLATYLAAPEHVYVLRGNHEYYVEYKGQVYGGVRPSEAIESLRPYAPDEMFKTFKDFFESLPNMLALGSLFFVHAGLPRERTLKERWTDLGSLNDKDLRFQMMWSDPSPADVIPAGLQSQSARFAFGRLQLQAFLQRIGCQGLVRGHEKVDQGFRLYWDDPGSLLMTIFSAGGAENNDIPPNSSYRAVTPHALTILMRDDQLAFHPWPIDYAAYNRPERNAFYSSAPQIEHRVETPDKA